MTYAKLGRTKSGRRALFRSLTTALFANERIMTTQGKATEVNSIAEKLITMAKRNDLHSRRLAATYLLDEDVTKKTVRQDRAPVPGPSGRLYQNHHGGYPAWRCRPNGLSRTGLGLGPCREPR